MSTHNVFARSMMKQDMALRNVIKVNTQMNKLPEVFVYNNQPMHDIFSAVSW